MAAFSVDEDSEKAAWGWVGWSAPMDWGSYWRRGKGLLGKVGTKAFIGGA